MKIQKLILPVYLLLSFLLSCSDDDFIFSYKPPGNGCKVKKIIAYPETTVDVTTFDYDDVGMITFMHQQFTDTAYTTAYHYNESHQVILIEDYLGTDYDRYTEVIWENGRPVQTRTFEEGELVVETYTIFKNNKPVTIRQVFSNREEVFKFTYVGDNLRSWYYDDELVSENTKFDNKKNPSLLLLSIRFSGWYYSKNNVTEYVSHFSPSPQKVNMRYRYNGHGYPIETKIGDQIIEVIEYEDCD